MDLAEGGPAGRRPEIAGPLELEMVDLARRVSKQFHRRRWVVPVRVPGVSGSAMRTGALLPVGDCIRGC